MTSALQKAKDSATPTVPHAPPPSPPPEKPAHDVVAGAMARAASQSTIHPLDTMKVRMQAGKAYRPPPGRPSGVKTPLDEVRTLYKGVGGAALAAGTIIGAYFAFYSSTKRFLRRRTDLHESAVAFVSGAVAAVGSSVVKVPMAVCIRSVQAGLYPNAIAACRSIHAAAGLQGLFTGFMPTLVEDVPDMAFKFATYESLRLLHRRMAGDRQASTIEDLLIGGVAGAASAAATTPLDVIKTNLMCTASSRPTFMQAYRSIAAQGPGVGPFFRGVGPRALSNGLNSAVFFCFFEALRQILAQKQQQHALQLSLASSRGAPAGRATALEAASRPVVAGPAEASPQGAPMLRAGAGRGRRNQTASLACLSLALPPRGRMAGLVRLSR